MKTPRLGRRAFLFGIGGTACLVAAPKLIVGSTPILWGDGAHDDTAALQALLDGKPIRLPSGDSFRPRFERGQVRLTGGVYLVGDTIRVRRGNVMTGATLKSSDDFKGPAMLMVGEPGARVDSLILQSSGFCVTGLCGDRRRMTAASVEGLPGLGGPPVFLGAA